MPCYVVPTGQICLMLMCLFIHGAANGTVRACLWPYAERSAAFNERARRQSGQPVSRAECRGAPGQPADWVSRTCQHFAVASRSAGAAVSASRVQRGCASMTCTPARRGMPQPGMQQMATQQLQQGRGSGLGLSGGSGAGANGSGFSGHGGFSSGLGLSRYSLQLSS